MILIIRVRDKEGNLWEADFKVDNVFDYEAYYKKGVK